MPHKWPTIERPADERGGQTQTSLLLTCDGSTTLTDPHWANTTVISSDVVERIQQLKEEPGQDIVQYGFGAVSTLLMQHSLLDELRLWIHPRFVEKAAPTTSSSPKDRRRIRPHRLDDPQQRHGDPQLPARLTCDIR